jgi:defect in organelle trafficking protein DotD
MTRRKKTTMVFCAALLMAGCSDLRSNWDSWTSSGPSVDSSAGKSVVATEPDIVSVKLAQAADKASKALDSIANIEQQRNPAVPPVQNDYANASASIMQPVSLRWTGPVEKVARVLAERAGLRFRVMGRTPDIPVVVTVDVYQQPILHVLRDIGLQVGSRADLSVDQKEGVVEVHYAAADQSR